MKNNSETKTRKTRKKSEQPHNTLICPVCGEEFEASENTKYIISGGYTCSWKCFLKEARKRDAERAERKENKKTSKK